MVYFSSCRETPSDFWRSLRGPSHLHPWHPGSRHVREILLSSQGQSRRETSRPDTPPGDPGGCHGQIKICMAFLLRITVTIFAWTPSENESIGTTSGLDPWFHRLQLCSCWCPLFCKRHLEPFVQWRVFFAQVAMPCCMPSIF